jgi:hypothetical protein
MPLEKEAGFVGVFGEKDGYLRRRVERPISDWVLST